MKKSQVVDLLGSQAELSRVVGVTRASVCDWPENMGRRLANEIAGALLAKGRITYKALVKRWPEYKGGADA